MKGENGILRDFGLSQAVKINQSRHFERTLNKMEFDLLFPPESVESRRHKLKRLVPTQNSYFLEIKDSQSNNMKVVFSHSQTTIIGSYPFFQTQP
jgi:hypothetical protein